MSPVIQPPNGTRDLYPIEAARRRFITEAWRRVSINHGFEEIDGPTFEHLELYTVKSGEGIVSELFSFRREGGEKDFALRPEFTPTLARMYAARAKSLSSPTKWFTVGPFFRAERPQRGRLREFLQWNCDVIGLPTAEVASEEQQVAARATADVEIIACVAAFMSEVGLAPSDASIRISSRPVVCSLLQAHGVAKESLDTALQLLDRVSKLKPDQARSDALALNFELDRFKEQAGSIERSFAQGVRPREIVPGEVLDWQPLRMIGEALHSVGLGEWCKFDLSVARGLAYYTGTVFEIIVDGERAVAGGGRYDNLIEMFGGPPTPAVGFGMGDVVLSLVLQDKGLMPSDAELLEIAGMRPDVFVISNGTPEADARLGGVVVELRRGGKAKAGDGVDTGMMPVPRDGVGGGLHVRRSYKATKKIGKLLQEAGDVRARFAVILESGTEATIKNLQTGEQDQSGTAIDQLAMELRKRLAVVR